ncbi:MAG: DUF2752 domain-containing protein [Terrimicrobiaceae bacterium]|nr:DUF2752 domain-containing protein [Terrimicrobiaceae bacterium]
MKPDVQAKAQPDHELLWLTVLAAVAAIGLAWVHFALPTPRCLFHTVTGLPCPTCGGTRCIRSLIAGDFGTALAWNPMVFLLVLAAGVYGMYAAAVTVLRWPRIRFRRLSVAQARAVRIGVALAVAANWIYLIVRFSRGA